MLRILLALLSEVASRSLPTIVSRGDRDDWCTATGRRPKATGDITGTSSGTFPVKAI